MFKRTDSAADWVLFDTSRDLNNTAKQVMYANKSQAEATAGTTWVDFVSN
jgi:primase-polymerase (primpol)-like protein